MNMLQKTAVLLIAVLGLWGCETLKSFDPSRPFPEQPIVSEKIRTKLATKGLNEFTIYVSQAVRYYDTTDALEVAKKAEEKTGKGANFTKDLPVLTNPPKKMISNALQFVRKFQKRIDGMGLKRVDAPCEECLIFLPQYAEFHRNRSTILMFASMRIFYLGEEVALARDNWFIGWRKGLITFPGSDFDDAVDVFADRALDETIQVLSRITLAGQKPSGPTTQ